MGTGWGGGLRFKLSPDDPFLSDNRALAVPPWTSLRELEYASLQLERLDAAQDPDYLKWLLLLLAPGSSLGGARPKASVVNEQGRLWMAKFPSGQDTARCGRLEGRGQCLSATSRLDGGPWARAAVRQSAPYLPVGTLRPNRDPRAGALRVGDDLARLLGWH